MTEVRYLDGPMAGVIQKRYLPDDRQARVPYDFDGQPGTLIYHRQECGGYSYVEGWIVSDD